MAKVAKTKEQNTRYGGRRRRRIITSVLHRAVSRERLFLSAREKRLSTWITKAVEGHEERAQKPTFPVLFGALMCSLSNKGG